MHPRPDLIQDQTVPIVITAVFDVKDKTTPRLLLLRRGEKVAHYKKTWSMPAGVIDNKILRERGNCVEAAILQSNAELAGELFLFPENLCGGQFWRRYSRVDGQKVWDTSLVVALTERPDLVYNNWEHDLLLWIPVSDILSGAEGVLPEPVTPNLLRDLEALDTFLRSLLGRA